QKARALVDEVTYTTRDLLIIADLTASLEVDGHRSDLVILKAARAQAAFDGRTRIVPNDIALAAELALPHRVKAGPFRKSDVGIEALEERIEQLKEQAAVEAEQTPSDEDDTGKKKRAVSRSASA
ncbi:MAG TPA: magnesium chelatase, partial [Anaerolineaceae bacterium]|nr:magnesium chelatase [Anaerolineaceae bacterium]